MSGFNANFMTDPSVLGELKRQRQLEQQMALEAERRRKAEEEERLRKEREAALAELSATTQRLRQETVDTSQALQDANPAIAQQQLFLEQIQAGIDQAAFEADQDPLAVTKQQISGMSLGRRMLNNFLLGAQQTVGGEKLRTTRQLLFERNLQQQDLARQRKDGLMKLMQQVQSDIGENARNAISGGVNVTGDAVSFENAQTQAQTSRSQQALQGRQQNLAEAKFAAEQEEGRRAIELQALYSIVQSNPDSVESLTAAASLAKSSGFLKASKAFQEAAEAIQKNEEAVEAAKAAAAASGKSEQAPQVFPVGIDGTFKTELLYDADGNITGERGRTFQLTSEFQKSVFASQRLHGNTAKAFAQIAEIDKTTDGGVFGKDGRAFLGIEIGGRLSSTTAGGILAETMRKLHAAASLDKPEDIAAAVSEARGFFDQALDQNAAEKQLYSAVVNLIASAVVDFTGAQATDREREFIRGALPLLTDRTDTFLQGLASIHLRSLGVDAELDFLNTLANAREGNRFKFSSEEVRRAGQLNYESMRLEFQELYKQTMSSNLRGKFFGLLTGNASGKITKEDFQNFYTFKLRNPNTRLTSEQFLNILGGR